MKEKLKDYGLWMSIIGCISMLVQVLGIRVDIPVLKEALIGICGILVTLGLISAPSGPKESDEDKESDDEE